VLSGVDLLGATELMLIIRPKKKYLRSKKLTKLKLTHCLTQEDCQHPVHQIAMAQCEQNRKLTLKNHYQIKLQQKSPFSVILSSNTNADQDIIKVLCTNKHSYTTPISPFHPRFPTNPLLLSTSVPINIVNLVGQHCRPRCCCCR